MSVEKEAGRDPKETAGHQKREQKKKRKKKKRNKPGPCRPVTSTLDSNSRPLPIRDSP